MRRLRELWRKPTPREITLYSSLALLGSATVTVITFVQTHDFAAAIVGAATGVLGATLTLPIIHCWRLLTLAGGSDQWT